MTTGALIFAYNNESLDYVRMAAWSARNIKRHLGIPVALVTDQTTDHEFDRVIIQPSRAQDSRWFSDVGHRVTWNNLGRPDAFDLSPWDRTLLLDADYVVASDRLKLMLDNTQSLVCHRWARDLAALQDFHGLNHFGRYHMPLYWATVVIFDKGTYARHVFDCMKMVRAHWRHYQRIYHDRSKTYRNDHALSIALGIVHGHGQPSGHIPWDLLTALPEYKIRQIDQDHYRIDFMRADNRAAWIAINGQDFHAMGKQALMDAIT